MKNYTWQQLHTKLTVMLHEVQTMEKSGQVSERFPRNHCTDILNIVAGFGLFNIDNRFSVEIHCAGDVVMVEFMYDDGAEYNE